MASGSFDPVRIRQAGNDLRDTADEVDRATEGFPDDIDAGAYSPWIVEMCTGIIARTGEVILNVDQCAQGLIDAAEGYEECERRNGEVVGQILRDLDEMSPSPLAPLPPPCPICGHSFDHDHGDDSSTGNDDTGLDRNEPRGPYTSG